MHRDDVEDHPLRAVAADVRNASTTLSRLARLHALDLAGLGAHRRRAARPTARRGRCARSSSLIASAPILATKAPSPYCSRSSRYCSSVISSFSLSSVVARIDDHVGLEVEDALEVAHASCRAGGRCGYGRPLKNQTCDTGAASSMWPMRSRRTLRLRDLDAAVVADDAAVLHALVLAAVALPVGDRAEDLLAEQAVLLRLERAVVDGLRLGHLAVRPASGSSPATRARSGSR